MAFIKYIPSGKKTPTDIHTTTTPEQQLWAELEILRHLTGRLAIYGKLVTAPFIDQAKEYFTDACRCSWKSSGLLYYYSYLNLAKALLVKNRTMSGVTLRSTSIYHGLTARPQNPANIIDFIISVHPPTSGRQKNIFAFLYKNITGSPWPFRNTIQLQLSDFINYSRDISYEVKSFYGTNKREIPVQSLVRDYGNSAWLEIAVYAHLVPEFQNTLITLPSSIIPNSAMSNLDYNDWLSAYDRTANSFQGHSLLRYFHSPYTNASRTNTIQQLYADAVTLFEPHFSPVPVAGENNALWFVQPNLLTNGLAIPWKPILSDYLFAFILSIILRYQPHIFNQNPKDAFLAEAWCTQAAITVLRYFLMEFTSPPLRLN